MRSPLYLKEGYFVKMLRKTIHACKYFLEITIPAVTFVGLLICFLIGVFMRYVLRNPQPWTYEISQICFVWSAMFATLTALESEDHIVFSMIYDELKPKSKNIMRLISSTIIIVFLTIAIYPSVLYLVRLTALTSVLKIPRSIVFIPYVLMFVLTIIRHIYRMVMDVKVFKEKTYDQNYNTGEKEMLI